eukprot:Skav234012  [mRNA]  locus=scaffold3484:101932:106917:+ [translate_table: standard]
MPRVWKAFFGLIMLLSFRVGEACNPGPSSWNLSVINPTGIAHKGYLLPELESEVIAVSETHLTVVGQHKFQKELKATNRDMRFCGGNPVLPKSSSKFCTGGKHSGVGFVSTQPCRPVGGKWEPSAWQTSRVHAAHLMVDGHWITGGVCYGYSYQSWKASVRHDTDALLQQIATKVLPFPGPKFICGDWNMEPEKCDFMHALKMMGWQELQDVMQARWNIRPVPTCKGATRKDYLMLCPMLQDRLISGKVHNDVFSDHAVLQASLARVGGVPREPVWIKPMKIELSREQRQAWQEHSAPIPASGLSERRLSPCRMTAGVNADGLVDRELDQEHTDRYRQVWADYEDAMDHWQRSQGSPGLLAQQKGRARTMEVTFRKAQPITIKPSRHGEHVLKESCPTRLIKGVFLQIRRLVNVQRVLKAFDREPTESRHQHAQCLWRAFLNANGFGQSFAGWWMTRPTMTEDAPIHVPQTLPPSTVVGVLLTDLEGVLDHLEHLQTKKCQMFIRQRYRDDINAIFRDVKDAGPMPVESLLTRKSATILDVPDAGSVVVDDASAFDDQMPVYGDLCPLRIEVVQDDQIWFEQEHQLVVGQQVSQVEPIGNVDQMFEMFIQAWQARWDKHRLLSSDHWNHILGFMEVALPCKPMQVQPLTVERWMSEVQRKPKKAAGGMDGVERSDLLNLPYEQQCALVALLNDVETTGVWPRQLLHGAIHSLQKTPQAESVDGYRPITILPLTYRTWSTIRGREMLQHLQSFLPGTLCGSANHQSAMTVWYAVQAQVEQAFLDESALCGAITDITKAFNCLPRVPLVGTAVLAGVAPQVVRPWMGLLTGLERHFVIRNQMSRGVSSATGFAEGCCLSVGAMLLANIAVHAYMTVACPSVRLWSYIDNWEVTCAVPEDLGRSLEKLQAFATVLDLTMDAKKAMVWAVDASHRRLLRQGDVPVVTHTRDLGGHMQFTRQLTVKTLVDKCDALGPMWNKLGRSLAPKHLKHRVLRMKAWPSALHACPGVHVSDAVLTQLRTAALQSLRLNKAGSNSMGYLGLCLHPMHDPECYALVQCVQNLRRWIPEDVFSAYAHDVAFVPDRQRCPGPIGVVFDRLEKVAWTWIGDAWWVDHTQRPIHLYDECIQSLLVRVTGSFQAMVGCRLSRRHGFEGMQDVDAATTQKSLSSLSVEEVGLLRTLHMGTFITADQTGQANRIAADHWKCKFCGAPDSLEHRHWQCVHTATMRAELSAEFWTWLHDQPPCTRLRGWATFPEVVGQFQNSLHGIPDRTAEFLCTGQKCTYTFFTDGAALAPQQRWCRLATWAWCVAVPGVWNFTVGGQGGVPGAWQTVLRAEVCAVIGVLQFCHAYGCGGIILCDNDLVVKQFRRCAQRGTRCYDPMDADADLWSVVRALLFAIEEEITIVHIYSHQHAEDECEAVRWACRGNDFADFYAQDAIHLVPNRIRQLQSQAHQAVVTQHTCHEQLMKYMAAVGKFSIDYGQPKADEPAETGQDALTAAPLDVDHIIQQFRGRVPYHFRESGYEQWLEWFAGVVDPHAPVRWVSWLELLVHYQGETGRLGVTCHRGESGNLRMWRPVDDETTTTWPDLISSFGRFGNTILRQVNSEWRAIHRRPTMWRVKFWLSCIPIRMRFGAIQVVEEFFRAHNIHGINSTKALLPLPFARPA